MAFQKYFYFLFYNVILKLKKQTQILCLKFLKNMRLAIQSLPKPIPNFHRKMRNLPLLLRVTVWNPVLCLMQGKFYFCLSFTWYKYHRPYLSTNVYTVQSSFPAFEWCIFAKLVYSTHVHIFHCKCQFLQLSF